MHFILQEKDTEPGDYIVRARGAWFGNRSISAEVDIQPGVYEVLPKIEAKRNADSPDVHEVVTKVAERNPQKLRQIGLNYDLANAMGLDQPTEEEQKLVDKKKKEAAEKRKKGKEAIDKEKAAFEAWKKEEKEEYEIWKRQKKRSEEKAKIEVPDPEPESVNADPAAPEAKDAPLCAESERGKSAPRAAEVGDTGSVEAATVELDERKPANTASEAELASQEEGIRSNGGDAPSDDNEAQHTPDEDPEPYNRGPLRAEHRRRHPPPHIYRPIPRGYYGDEPRPRPVPRDRSIEDNISKPWNAVCVLGLRIYTQDAGVSIKLVKPKNAEEGAILDVGGDTAAGATM